MFVRLRLLHVGRTAHGEVGALELLGARQGQVEFLGEVDRGRRLGDILEALCSLGTMKQKKTLLRAG